MKIYKKRCKICGGLFESKRKDAKYCCDKCRQKAIRKGKPVTDNVTDNLRIDFDNMTREELMRDLEAKSIKQLLEEGYWVPNWKKSHKTRNEAFAQLLAITQQHPAIYMFQGLRYIV